MAWDVLSRDVLSYIRARDILKFSIFEDSHI